MNSDFKRARHSVNRLRISDIVSTGTVASLVDVVVSLLSVILDSLKPAPWILLSRGAATGLVAATSPEKYRQDEPFVKSPPVDLVD